MSDLHAPLVVDPDTGEIDPHLDPQTVTSELHIASRQLGAAAVRLGQIQREYDGRQGEDGDFHAGPGRRFEQAIAIRMVRLHREARADGRRPDGEDARRTIAEVEIRDEQPDLAAAHDILQAEIFALRQFISAQRVVIEGHRSVLSALKVLT